MPKSAFLLLRCSKCKKVAPPIEFKPDKRRPSGRSSWCKACTVTDTNARHGRTFALLRANKHPDPLYVWLVHNGFPAARVRAKKKGLQFSLTLSWARAQKNHCAVTGIPFVYDPWPGTNVHPQGPSLDKINAKLGYTQDNTRVVLAWVNVAKQGLSDTNFKKMIGYTADALYPTSSLMKH